MHHTLSCIFAIFLTAHSIDAGWSTSTTPERVLDVGTGTSIWPMDFADEFLSAVVVATDLSLIQPSWVPPNAKFVIEDAESDWLYSPAKAFDYIHGEESRRVHR